MSTLDKDTVEAVLKDAVESLNKIEWVPPGGSATASAFEKKAHEVIRTSAHKFNVKNEVVLYSGRRFPDIVFKDSPFGVEIKTAQKGWSCLGNSVAASTLVDGVSEVYLLFGSGLSPIKARFARYEDAVKSVEVTHSPRYVLDMDVEPGEGYLNEIGKNLSEMLSLEDPISCVVEEARKKLKPGEHLWWVSERIGSPITIRLWNSLKSSEKHDLIAKAFALFPDSILRYPEANYSDYIVWLSQRHSILNPSVRDSFTAGGRVSQLEFGPRYLEDAPQIFRTLSQHMSVIKSIIYNDDSAVEWSLYYQCALEDCDSAQKRFHMWRSKVEPLLINRAPEQEYSIACIKAFLDS